MRHIRRCGEELETQGLTEAQALIGINVGEGKPIPLGVRRHPRLFFFKDAK